MSARHILGNGMFELTNFIPYGNPLADVQMLLCSSLLILGVTMYMYKAEGRKLNGMKKPILNSGGLYFTQHSVTTVYLGPEY